LMKEKKKNLGVECILGPTGRLSMKKYHVMKA